MRIFVYELTCGGGLAGLAESNSLRTEGWAMLAALLEDLRRAPGIETITLLDEQCPAAPANLVILRPRTEDEASAFRKLARDADGTVVIAPEFDDLLATRCDWVVACGSRLLGPSPAAVRLTGDKLALAGHLLERGVPTPDCRVLGTGTAAAAGDFPAVWKPRTGAGSQATFLVHAPQDLAVCAATARQEGWHGEAVLQRFVPGLAASVAFLIGPRQSLSLLPAAQHLSTDGRFHYLGGSVPLPADLGARAESLARRAVATVAGLCGYVGVDVVLGELADGSQDWVIEINPRLTTSYVGLRALAETNLAAALATVATGAAAIDLKWRTGQVEFQADGTVEYRGAVATG